MAPQSGFICRTLRGVSILHICTLSEAGMVPPSQERLFGTISVPLVGETPHQFMVTFFNPPPRQWRIVPLPPQK